MQACYLGLSAGLVSQHFIGDVLKRSGCRFTEAAVSVCTPGCWLVPALLLGSPGPCLGAWPGKVAPGAVQLPRGHHCREGQRGERAPRAQMTRERKQFSFIFKTENFEISESNREQSRSCSFTGWSPGSASHPPRHSGRVQVSATLGRLGTRCRIPGRALLSPVAPWPVGFLCPIHVGYLGPCLYKRGVSVSIEGVQRRSRPRSERCLVRCAEERTRWCRRVSGERRAPVSARGWGGSASWSAPGGVA